jgi:hypothetical protein
VQRQATAAARYDDVSARRVRAVAAPDSTTAGMSGSLWVPLGLSAGLYAGQACAMAVGAREAGVGEPGEPTEQAVAQGQVHRLLLAASRRASAHAG